jgi:hypothetical protein
MVQLLHMGRQQMEQQVPPLQLTQHWHTVGVGGAPTIESFLSKVEADDDAA